LTSKIFDRSLLTLLPLSRRKHELTISAVRDLVPVPETSISKKFNDVSLRIIVAKEKKAAVIFMMGAHVIRAGVQRYIIDLMERGFISCIAMNGAGVIHDYEFSLVGGTTESVAKYISSGQFGLWQETGKINDIINAGYKNDPSIGLGESVGQAILAGRFPYKDSSLLAAAARLNIPVTVHVGIGYDIIHQHPNCSGAATGQLSYNDFLKFSALLQNLEDGVVMNFGSAVMAPEVFLKGLSMARNVAWQKGRHIRRFCTLVCDIREIEGETSVEPTKSDPTYYFRPWKTMLVRTVQDGGESFYVRGPHSETVPALWSAIGEAERS
jgi:hypothetical protein